MMMAPMPGMTAQPMEKEDPPVYFVAKNKVKCWKKPLCCFSKNIAAFKEKEYVRMPNNKCQMPNCNN